jgi:hypothetical protein
MLKYVQTSLRLKTLGLQIQNVTRSPCHNTFFNCLSSARFARKKGERGSFFGILQLCPKNEPPLLLFCERSEQKVSKLALI